MTDLHHNGEWQCGCCMKWYSFEDLMKHHNMVKKRGVWVNG